MSYSASVKAKTKAEAKGAVVEKFNEIVAGQPVHQADRDAAQSAVKAFIDTLTEPGDEQQISVSFSGSLSWREEGVFTGAGMNVSASLIAADPVPQPAEDGPVGEAQAAEATEAQPEATDEG